MKKLFILVCLALFVFSTIADAVVENDSRQDNDDRGDHSDHEIDDGQGGRSMSKKTVFSAFVQSLSSIVVSELGDKTFFIAAIMAMRYNRLAVLGGALFALFLMTALSCGFGQVIAFLPTSVTHVLITVLFFFFGGKLLYDAYHDDGEENDEQAEVEIELNQMHAKLMKGTNSQHQEHQDAEIEYIVDGKVAANHQRDLESTDKKASNCATQIEQVAARTVFWQALTLTFLGEWGDRSQLATIALAAEASPLFVFIGGFLGHVLCTSLAVVGGKLLAKKISERTVNICGGVLFLLFGIHNLFKGPE